MPTKKQLEEREDKLSEYEGLLKYYEACDELKDDFLMEVCEDTPLEDIDCHWVGSKAGGVLWFNDEFVNFKNIVEYFEEDYNSELFWKWMENRDTIGAKNYTMREFKLNQQ